MGLRRTMGPKDSKSEEYEEHPAHGGPLSRREDKRVGRKRERERERESW